jgi:hypothetical protein
MVTQVKVFPTGFYMDSTRDRLVELTYPMRLEAVISPMGSPSSLPLH